MAEQEKTEQEKDKIDARRSTKYELMTTLVRQGIVIDIAINLIGPL